MNYEQAGEEWDALHPAYRFVDTGNVEEFGVPECDRCGNPHLKWSFEIKDIISGETFWVGSECINRFSSEVKLKKQSKQQSIDYLARFIGVDPRAEPLHAALTAQSKQYRDLYIFELDKALFEDITGREWRFQTFEDFNRRKRFYLIE